MSSQDLFLIRRRREDDRPLRPRKGQPRNALRRR